MNVNVSRSGGTRGLVALGLYHFRGHRQNSLGTSVVEILVILEMSVYYFYISPVLVFMVAFFEC